MKVNLGCVKFRIFEKSKPGVSDSKKTKQPLGGNETEIPLTQLSKAPKSPSTSKTMSPRRSKPAPKVPVDTRAYKQIITTLLGDHKRTLDAGTVHSFFESIALLDFGGENPHPLGTGQAEVRASLAKAIINDLSEYGVKGLAATSLATAKPAKPVKPAAIGEDRLQRLKATFDDEEVFGRFQALPLAQQGQVLSVLDSKNVTAELFDNLLPKMVSILTGRPVRVLTWQVPTQSTVETFVGAAGSEPITLAHTAGRYKLVVDASDDRLEPVGASQATWVGEQSIFAPIRSKIWAYMGDNERLGQVPRDGNCLFNALLAIHEQAPVDEFSRTFKGESETFTAKDMRRVLTDGLIAKMVAFNNLNAAEKEAAQGDDVLLYQINNLPEMEPKVFSGKEEDEFIERNLKDYVNKNAFKGLTPEQKTHIANLAPDGAWNSETIDLVAPMIAQLTGTQIRTLSESDGGIAESIFNAQEPAEGEPPPRQISLYLHGNHYQPVLARSIVENASTMPPAVETPPAEAPPAAAA